MKKLSSLQFKLVSKLFLFKFECIISVDSLIDDVVLSNEVLVFEETCDDEVSFEENGFETLLTCVFVNDEIEVEELSVEEDGVDEVN